MPYLIELQHETDITGVDTHALEQLAARALDIESVPQPSELSIMLADDPTVHELNRTYRNTDSPTDVLSFAQGEGEAFAQPAGTTPHLGDVIISLDTARRQAAEHGLELQDEVAHLLVHGILHLLGYDHEDAEDAAVMRLQEERMLGATHHH
jgi:probable rRNA maturation factor